MTVNFLLSYSDLVKFTAEQDLYFCVSNTIYLVLDCITEMIRICISNSKLFCSIGIFVIFLFVVWLLFYTPALAKKPKGESDNEDKGSKETAELDDESENSEGSSSGEDESKEGVEGSSSGDEKSKEKKNKDVKGTDKGSKGSSSLEENSDESNEISSTATGGTSRRPEGQPSPIGFPASLYEDPRLNISSVEPQNIENLDDFTKFLLKRSKK